MKVRRLPPRRSCANFEGVGRSSTASCGIVYGYHLDAGFGHAVHQARSTRRSGVAPPPACAESLGLLPATPSRGSRDGNGRPNGRGGFVFGMSIAIIMLSTLLAACGGTDSPLPHSLYFLDGPGEEVQVWRLERDGFTRVQITNEEGGVDEFAVSPADGTIAFVGNNQLFLVDGDGENRRLVTDGRQADKEAEASPFHGLVGNPAFSPDGRTLAYALDGLHLYDLASAQDEHVLANLGNLLGESFVFAKETYAPGPWSPDGSRLLIIMGYFEGSTLAVMNPGAEQPFLRLRSDGPVCCLFGWAADSRSVLVANPFYTGDVPGLWRYDAETGEETVVIPGLGEDGSINFVGWPHQLTSGDLVFFQVNLERFSPDVGIPLRMVRSQRDGSNQTHLRPEAFHIGDAVWAQDGSLAILLGSCCENGRQVVLARRDGSPLRVLIDEGQGVRDLAWGP